MNLPEKSDSLRDEVERLREEAERLRELLEGFVDDIVTLGEDWEHLLAEIEKDDVERLRFLLMDSMYAKAKVNEENERLRELVSAGKDDRKAIDELVDENPRLREENERLLELLRRSLFRLISDHHWLDIVNEIKKEVGDE